MDRSYLTQYCNLLFELKSKGVVVGKSQRVILMELSEKAVQQSGLTFNELTLISMCRKYNIFTKVNTYAHKIKRH